MRLTEVRILTGDQGKSFRFWRDVAGLEVSWGDETGAYAAFRPGRDEVALAVFSRADMTAAVDGNPTGSVVLAFEVDDVDQVLATLRDRGATVVAGPTDRPEWGDLRTAHLRDPDGNLIELNAQMPKAAT